MMDRLASIDTPILFIAGALDRPEYAASGTYIERKAPSARLVVMPDAEHSPQELTCRDRVRSHRPVRFAIGSVTGEADVHG